MAITSPKRAPPYSAAANKRSISNQNWGSSLNSSASVPVFVEVWDDDEAMVEAVLSWDWLDMLLSLSCAWWGVGKGRQHQAKAKSAMSAAVERARSGQTAGSI